MPIPIKCIVTASLVYISVLHNEQWHIGGKRNTDFYMDGKDGGPSHDAPWSGYLRYVRE